MSSVDIGKVGTGLAGLLIVGAGMAAGPGIVALTIMAAGAMRKGVDRAVKARGRGRARREAWDEGLTSREEADQAWARIERALEAEIEGVGDPLERERLLASLSDERSGSIEALCQGDGLSIERIVEEVRTEIATVRLDERILASRMEELSQMLYRAEQDAPPGFRAEIDALRIIPEGRSIEERIREVGASIAKAQRLVEEIRQADALSPLALEAPHAPPTDVVDEERRDALALAEEIRDIAWSASFFDEPEAEALRPLVDEALEALSPAPRRAIGAKRLRLIRAQVKATYDRARERAMVTELSKRDLRSFLPTMRRAQDTEALCARIEELIEAPVVTREERRAIREAVEVVLKEQMEPIADTILAERAEAVLGGMGYALLDEDGGPLSPGKMRTLSTPWDGYRVQMKVTDAGEVATRFVRVAGSEEERDGASEYQRQKDAEAGKRWCEDLQRFYGAMEAEGILMRSAFREEPDEEGLVVVVDPVEERPPTAKARRSREHLREARS